MSKLTKAQVDEIRSAYRSGVSVGDLAKRFGIHRGHLWYIVRNKWWVNTKEEHADALPS